jgi:hypothetical protein
MNPPPSLRATFRCLLLAACGLASSCSWLEDDPPPANPNAPRLVGRIASIPPGRRFVLIESYGTWKVPAGSILSVHGPDGRSANLLATGESLRHHAAADIQSGTLEVGDGVYLQPNPQKSAEKPELPPAAGPEPGDR